MNKLKLYIKILLTFTVIALYNTSCRKDLPNPHANDNAFVNSYSELFERFWNQMNNNYQFWDQDTTNWDAMYTRYKPLFDKLDINNDSDQRKSIQYFHEMLAGNLDGHLSLSFYAPAIEDSFVQPRYDQDISAKNPLILPGEAQRTIDYISFSYQDIDKQNYLDAGNISGNYQGNNVLEGTLNNNILYFGFDGEVLTQSLQDPMDNIFKSAYNAYNQALYNNLNLKGIIIDMRSSYGGDGHDGVILASNMIDKPLLWGTVRHKSGPGRLDYTPWVPTYINPAPGAKAIKVPLFILTDVNTFSAAEYITSALHAIPGAVTIGTATFGGMSGNNLVNNVQGDGYTFYSTWGQDNFMDFYMSPAAYRFIDGKSYPFGFPPDIEVPFDTIAIQSGRDTQLEKALSLIR